MSAKSSLRFRPGFRVLTVLLAAGLTLLLPVGCGRDGATPASGGAGKPGGRPGGRPGGKSGQAPVPVAVAKAVRGPIATYFHATATLEAEKQAQVLARVGGVVRDCPEGWTDRILKYLHETLPPAIKDFETLLIRNRIFIERCKGVGVISHDDAVNWSLTGPVAPACTVAPGSWGMYRSAATKIRPTTSSGNWSGAMASG